ncbi:MAG: hypothetical protein PF436_03435 [Prolixibacteraceae bacterium]|jgi:hypothetical protein|nr:hypothetical protein [Prolixibacteraceae bacterium]
MKRYILIVSVLSVLFFGSCTKDVCELTSDDMDWLLEEYDSLYYLKNGTDTVVVKVETFLGQSEYVWQWGIRTGDNNYVGSNDIYLLDSTYNIHIGVEACNDNIRIYLKNTKRNELFRRQVLKNSFLDSSIIVNGIVYSEYFSIIEENDTLEIKKLYFAKKYGVVKLLTSDSILLERIPLNID